MRFGRELRASVIDDARGQPRTSGDFNAARCARHAHHQAICGPEIVSSNSMAALTMPEWWKRMLSNDRDGSWRG